MIKDKEFFNVVKSFGLKTKISRTPFYFYSVIKCFYNNVVIVSKFNTRVHIRNPNMITIDKNGNFEILYKNSKQIDSIFECKNIEQLKESLRTCLKELKEKKIQWEKDQLDKEFNQM